MAGAQCLLLHCCKIEKFPKISNKINGREIILLRLYWICPFFPTTRNPLNFRNYSFSKWERSCSRRLGLLDSADAFLIRDLEFLRVPHWRFGDLRPQNQPEMRWRYRTSSISGKHPGTPPLGNLVLLLYLRISVPDIMWKALNQPDNRESGVRCNRI